MSRSRYLSRHLALAMVAAFGMASAGSPAAAQPAMRSRQGVKLKRASRGLAGLLSARRQRAGRDPHRPGGVGPDAKVVDATVNGARTRASRSYDQVRRRQADRRPRRRPLHDQLPRGSEQGRNQPGRDEGRRQRPRRLGLRGRPLGPRRPVEHGRRRRPDRRVPAACRGPDAGHGREVEAGRGAAPLAGRLARSGPLGRPQDPRAALVADAQEPTQGRRPGVAVRGGPHRGDRRADRPGHLCARRHQHGCSG